MILPFLIAAFVTFDASIIAPMCRQRTSALKLSVPKVKEVVDRQRGSVVPDPIVRPKSWNGPPGRF